jgi:methylenetetrahydrofolate dehydrogenase (NADP+)/methenyltetrahydrofolate cyclohydrolase
MIVDGKALAQKWQAEIKARLEGEEKILTIVAVDPDLASQKFIEQKVKLGEKLGVEVRVFEYEFSISTSEVIEEIEKFNHQNTVRGIVVQLPLPKNLDREAIIQAISPAKDVDALGRESSFTSPVVLAVQRIFTEYQIDLNNKKIAIVGYGALVGKPLANWLIGEGYEVEVISDPKSNLEQLVNFEVVISGVGVPNLIKPEMIKEGAVVIDVGTSELNGTLTGDVDLVVETKAYLFSKTPGGVGPLTVTALFANLSK